MGVDDVCGSSPVQCASRHPALGAMDMGGASIVGGGARQGLAAEQHTTSACDVGEGRPPSPPSCDSSLAPATPGSLDQATASAVTRAGIADFSPYCTT